MKQIVKKAIRRAALEYLNKAKEGMSKLANLKYEELNMQEYLSDANMNNRQKQLAFNLRTRMGKFERNMGNKGPCVTCKLPGTEDSQSHHLQCVKIVELCQGINIASVKYDNIYSDRVCEIQETIEVLDKTIRKREQYLDTLKTSKT